jgi:hypothetical protein
VSVGTTSGQLANAADEWVAMSMAANPRFYEEDVDIDLNP